MSRALGEYQVLGIRTTIPFFTWLMRQPEYREGRYDTTWLDCLLIERQGQSFNELEPNEEQLVAIAAAVDTYLRAHAAAPDVTAGATSLWQRVAREEALRR